MPLAAQEAPKEDSAYHKAELNADSESDYNPKIIPREVSDREPEKYLDWLPQFGGTLVQTGQTHEHRLELGRLIKPMGIITLFLLVLTAAGRLFRKKVPKFLLRWHKRLGIITLVSALIHATLVLIAH